MRPLVSFLIIFRVWNLKKNQGIYLKRKRKQYIRIGITEGKAVCVNVGTNISLTDILGNVHRLSFLLKPQHSVNWFCLL